MVFKQGGAGDKLTFRKIPLAACVAGGGRCGTRSTQGRADAGGGQARGTGSQAGRGEPALSRAQAVVLTPGDSGLQPHLREGAAWAGSAAAPSSETSAGAASPDFSSSQALVGPRGRAAGGGMGRAQEPGRVGRWARPALPWKSTDPPSLGERRAAGHKDQATGTPPLVRVA